MLEFGLLLLAREAFASRLSFFLKSYSRGLLCNLTGIRESPPQHWHRLNSPASAKEKLGQSYSRYGTVVGPPGHLGRRGMPVVYRLIRAIHTFTRLPFYPFTLFFWPSYCRVVSLPSPRQGLRRVWVSSPRSTHVSTDTYSTVQYVHYRTAMRARLTNHSFSPRITFSISNVQWSHLMPFSRRHRGFTRCGPGAYGELLHTGERQTWRHGKQTVLTVHSTVLYLQYSTQCQPAPKESRFTGA